jgi:YVTN family beta-propeller protein
MARSNWTLGLRFVLVLLLANSMVVGEALGAGDRIFVANSGDHSISVIDTETDREVKVLPTGLGPGDLALRSREPLLAVANGEDSTVTLIDPVALEVVEPEVQVGPGPVAVEFNEQGTVLFSAHYHGKLLQATDVATLRPRGEPLVLPGIPKRLLLSPHGERLFVLLFDEAGAVAIVDPGTLRIEKIVPVDRFPRDFALTPDGKRLLVASFDTDRISVIELSTLEAKDTLRVDTGDGLVLHPVRSLLYSMVSFDNEVAVFDYGASRQVATIPVGSAPTYSTISPGGRFLYVVCNEAAQVMKIDTENNQVLLRIAVGSQPADALYFSTTAQPATPSARRESLAWLWVVVAVLIVAAGGAMLRRRTAERTRG